MEPLPPVATAASPAQPRFRWAMLALMSMMYAGFGMTVASIAPLVDTISQDLGINSSQMGLVLGAWQLVYIGVAYATGTLVDRLGVRRAIALGGAVITLSLLLRAAAVDFFSLFFIVALFGIGGPVISTGSPKVAAVWFRGRARGMASGVSFTATVLGGILTLAATNSVVVPLTGHWRLAFVVYGGVTLLATLVWWFLARDRVPGAAVERPQEMPALGLAGLLRIPNVRLVLVLAFAVLFLNHGLNNWLPTILADKGMSDARAGLLAAVPSAVGIGALLIIPGVVRHGYRGPTIAVLMLAGAGSTIGIGLLGGGGLAALLSLSGLARFPLNSLLLLVLMDTPNIGAARMGAAGGIFFAVAEVGGFSGPFLVGMLRDLTDSLFSGVLLLGITAAALTPLALAISERRDRAGA